MHFLGFQLRILPLGDWIGLCVEPCILSGALIIISLAQEKRDPLENIAITDPTNSGTPNFSHQLYGDQFDRCLGYFDGNGFRNREKECPIYYRSNCYRQSFLGIAIRVAGRESWTGRYTHYSFAEFFTTFAAFSSL